MWIITLVGMGIVIEGAYIDFESNRSMKCKMLEKIKEFKDAF